MNEAERWINGKGPEPACITDLLASSRAASRAARAAREVEMSPALKAELDSLVDAAVAEVRQVRTRRRRIKIGLAAGAGVAVAAGAVALVLGTAAITGPRVTSEAAANELMLSPALSPEASASAVSQPAKPADGRPPTPR